MTIRLKVTRLDDSADIALLMSGENVTNLKAAGENKDITLYVGQPLLITEMPNMAEHNKVIQRALNGAIKTLKEAKNYDSQDDKIALRLVNEYRAALRSLGLEESA